MTVPIGVNRGDTLSNEYSQLQDRHTGATIHQITSHPSINHSFFFLNPSFRPGRSGDLGFVSHRGGHPQLFLFTWETRSSQCLTQRDDVHAFSSAFTPDGKFILYTTTRGQIRSVDVESLDERMVFDAAGWSLGECSISHDGRYLVTAGKCGVDHGLFVVDVLEASGDLIHRSAMKMIHAQFHPSDNSLIEYAGDPAPRLWLIHRDGSDNRCLYENTVEQFIVHESFLGTSDDLIFAVWPYQLARMNIREGTMRTVCELNTWHMASSRDGRWIISDTAHPDRGLLLIDPRDGQRKVICHPGSSNQGSQWKKDQPAGPEVFAAIRSAEQRELSWMEMKVDSVYGPQWTHPHPAFNDSGSHVVFTSDRSGWPQVYVVEIDSAR